jgi:mRNA-degrading endonuclease toxin of MazEF toxin-antitoxin module
MLIPLTTKLTSEEAFPLRIRLPQGHCRLKEDSELMIDQMAAWDNAFFKEDLGSIPEDIQKEVKRAIKEFLNLD